MKDRGKRGNGATGIAVVLLLSPLLYVLSVGPAAKLNDLVGADPSYIRAFYAPVVWLHDHTPLERPLELYLALWGTH